MTKLLTPNAKQQFFTDGSTVAAGYLLYTYAANTTDPLATYSNRAGTSANANPIILDARGEATIYLTPGSVYDFVLKTPLGATVWTREDVAAQAGEADAVFFTQGGTGAVPRTMQEKSRETISATDYFTDAERAQVVAGTLADFTTSIQKAIDYAETFAATGGATVRFPAGKYGYTALTVKANNVVLECSGEAYLLKMATTGNGIVVGNQTSIVYGVELRGFQLGSSVTGTLGNLVTFIKTGQCGVYGLMQTAAFGAPYDGLRVTTSSQFTFSDCQLQDCGHDGVIFEDCVDVYLDNSRSDSHGNDGFVFNKVSGCYASNVTAYDNGLHALHALSTFASPVLSTTNQHWFWNNVIGDTSGSHNWNLLQIQQARFVSCWAATQRVTNVDLHGFLIANAIDVEFNGCTATNNNGCGLFLQNTCSHIRVVGGGFHGNGLQAGSANRVGIYADAVASLTLSGVTSTDALRAALALALVQQYGVKLTAATGVKISGCDFSGNAVGGLDIPTSVTSMTEYGNYDGLSTSYASTNPTTTVGPLGDVFTITGTNDIYDIRPRWPGRRLKLVFSSTARLMDKAAGSAFALPSPAVQPAANGTAEIVFGGTYWNLVSFSVNDGV